MITEQDFEDIRPYYDHEINPALHRLVAVPDFGKILDFLFPERDKNEIMGELTQITTALDFQKKFMHPLVYSIVHKTSRGLTSSGFEHLTHGTPYLFVANHRDIVLDSAILQVLLVDHGHETSEITFGSNLMTNRFIIDFGKINRMFTVYRGGNKIEMFRNAKILSAYVRHTLTRKRISAWIAQRNGRTKDGNDRTESGLLKMFNISSTREFEESFRELNMVPLSISYEFEPCCALKVREISVASRGQTYHKAPNEDLMSILSGITRQKGRIHLAVCPPVNSFLHESRGIQVYNDRISWLTAGIDKAIHGHYKLWPSNYIACDLLEAGTKHTQYYTSKQKEEFIGYMHQELAEQHLDQPEYQELLLKLYAQPVLNSKNSEF